MAGYLIANIDVKDPAKFEEYREKVVPVIKKFGGRYLIRGGDVRRLEGNLPVKRVVVLDFDSIAGLFYLKGGAAFVNYNTYNINGQVTTVTCHPGSFNPSQGCQAFDTPVSTPFNFNAPSTSRWGWTIGLGTEWVVFDNWSIFGEWDYLNFGNHSATFTDANAGSTQFSVKQSINELKLGINYRFGNPLPGQYP